MRKKITEKQYCLNLADWHSEWYFF